MTPYANYLRDTIESILDSAREARADYASKATQSGVDSAQFEAGRALAYYEVAATMISQLRAFEIPLENVGLPTEFDVEKELL